MRTTERARWLASLTAAAWIGAATAGTQAGERDTHELGRRVYNFRCYFCHGYAGDARTLASTYLQPKPRDFTSLRFAAVSRESMLRTLLRGRSGTAMQSFRNVLGAAEAEAVIDFIRAEFMVARAANTRYHSSENGWPRHDRYAAAFPFARAEIALATPAEHLTPTQRAGRRMYLSSCISCHDRGRAPEGYEVAWESRPLSYPLNGDATTNVPPPGLATQYAIHDRPPRLAGLSAGEKRGEKLYQANCAFCHAADGTGKNWIGAFLEPHARDLTGAELDGVDRARVAFVIREGLPNTSMPAWKHVLTEGEVQDVAAYVLRAFRAGRSALHAPSR